MMLIDYFLTNTFMCTDVCVYTLASCQTQTTMTSHPVCFCLFSIFPKLDLSVCLSVFVSSMPGHTAGHSGLCVTSPVMKSHKHEMNTT